MKKRLVSVTIIVLILSNVLALAFNIRQVYANGTIYIRADGSVDPPTAPIQRDGDVYVLTGNITSDAHGIVIERSNMTLDGNGHTLHRTTGFSRGIDLSYQSNVTIKNVTIRNFAQAGIYLWYSSHNIIRENTITTNLHNGIVGYRSEYNDIFENNITDNRAGIYLYSLAEHNSIFGNFISTNEDYGLWLDFSSNNTVFENDIIGNTGYGGIRLRGSYRNSIFGNNIVSNEYGIYILSRSSNSTISHNSFYENTQQVYDASWDYYPSIQPSFNTWDAGYPSGGNYWSDCNGSDFYSGPDQTETGSDSIWDDPYVIDENNRDRYPLVNAPNLTLPWVDSDRDGILNYLEYFDTPEYGIDTLMARDTILGADWNAKILKIGRASFSVSYSYVMAELYRWGVKRTDLTSRVWPIIIDYENILLWLDSLQDTIPFLSPLVDLAREMSCFDGHVRYLLLLHSDLTDDEVVDLLLQFCKAFMSTGANSAEKWFNIFAEVITHIDFDIYRLKGVLSVGTEPIFDLADTLGEFTDFVDSLKFVKDFVLMSALLAVEILKIVETGGASLAIRTVMFFLEHVALDSLNISWIKSVLNFIDPPEEKMALQLHDSTTGELLLGYNATASEDINDFPNGIYLALNDSAFMILSRSSVDYNFTVYSATSTAIIPYSLSTRDCMTNQTVTTGGFLPPNETATTLLRIENDNLQMSYLAVTANFSSINPNIGDTVIANVSVTDNLGEAFESCSVAAIVGNQFVPAQDLGGGKHQLTLNTTTMHGFYNITIFTAETPDGYLQGISIYPLVVGIFDVAVVTLTCSKTVVGESCSAPIEVTIENQANYTQTSLTLYANETIILNQSVSLLSHESQTVTFAWNTTLFATGQYVIKAYIGPILGEIDTTDNTFIDGNLTVAIPGDITGPTLNVPDGKCDIRDIALVARYFGQNVPPAPPNCDITGPTTGVPDEKIGIEDLATVVTHFGEIDP